MGSLDGIKVIEIAGIGPGSFCAMMLSDMLRSHRPALPQRLRVAGH